MSAGFRFALLQRVGEWARCWFCWLVVLVVLAIQFLVGAVEAGDRPGWWYETFGLEREGFLRGRIWTIFTYGLLHGGWLHAGINVLFLLAFGSRLEATLGSGVVARTLCGGVVAGGIAHLLLVPAGAGGAFLLVGLSGGCVALLLLQTTLSPESRMWPLPVSGRSLGWGILLSAILLSLLNPSLGVPGLSALGGLLSEQGFGDWFRIGHACHAGGGIYGYLAGRWILRPRPTLARLQRERDRREGR